MDKVQLRKNLGRMLLYFLPTCLHLRSTLWVPAGNLDRLAPGVSTRLRQSTRWGGTGERRVGGTNFKPRKQLENAATPTRRAHAVLGVFAVIRFMPLATSQDLTR
jgi:hypothetical protein